MSVRGCQRRHSRTRRTFGAALIAALIVVVALPDYGSGKEEGKFTAEEAVRIVAEKLCYESSPNSHLVVDRMEKRSGRDYHVLQGYNLIITDPVKQTGHAATWGWFLVDTKTGEAFRWDLVEDKLADIQPMR